MALAVIIIWPKCITNYGSKDERRFNAVQHNFSYGTTMTEAKYASEVIFTKVIPYLALTGKLWGVFCEDLGENQPRYTGTALYCE